jgi:ubiquinone/menaquinone biosynthesis C-methylase UbiE
LEIRRILKDDGILILGTPNYNSIFSKILRERWPSIQPKYHLFLFSPQTINLLFKRTGFKLVYLSTENREFNTKNILIKSAYNFMSEIISKLGYGEAMLITASKSDIL